MGDENNTFENNVNETPESDYQGGMTEDNYSYRSEQTGNDYGSGKGQGTGLGIASMVCGILSIVLLCCVPYAPIILGIVAIVLGIVQIVKNEKKGMAIAGIVCGAVGLVVYVLLVGVVAYMISTEGYEEFLEYYNEIMSQYYSQ